MSVQMVVALKRLMGVHLVISCAVIDHKLGHDAHNIIGLGLKELFLNIQQNSYHNLPLTHQFSLRKASTMKQHFLLSCQIPLNF